MEMQQLQSTARTERKKDLYILSLDGSRVFWVVSIALLVLVFLFLLGYWIGHDTVSAGQGAAEGNYAGANPGGDLVTLKRDLELAGQGRSMTGLDDKTPTTGESGMTEKKDLALSDDKTGTRVQGEQDTEKPKIDETTLTSKSEKREFETLRTKPKKTTTRNSGTTAQKRTTSPVHSARPAAPRDAQVDGKYQVQVASFGSRSGAEALASRLKGKQYRPSIVSSTVSGKEFYRVRVGGYESYEAASRVVANLKSSGDGSGAYIVQR